MPYAVAAAGVTAGAAIFSSKQSKKASKEANKIAREQLDFAKQRYSDYQALYGDINKQLVADAAEGVKADLQGVTNRAAADSTQQFAKAEAELERNNARIGINPNSGRAQSNTRQLALTKAATEAGNISRARETERTQAEEKTYARRAQVAQIGNSMLNGASADITSASAGVQAGLNAQAGRDAATAGQLFGTAGQIGGLYLSGALDSTGSKTPLSLTTGTSVTPATYSAPSSSPTYTGVPMLDGLKY